jgi:hypothetical protein
MSRGRERGSVSVFFAVLVIFFIAMAGVVAEGSRRLGNISRAQDLASEAARAAAATLQVTALAEGNTLIDQNAEDGAVRQASELLERSGEQVRFEIDVSPSGRSVAVWVIVEETSWIPGFDIDGFGTHTAQVIDPSEVP